MSPLLARPANAQLTRARRARQVRLQGDLAKPPEQRLNYKHALDGLVRVRRCNSARMPRSLTADR